MVPGMTPSRRRRIGALLVLALALTMPGAALSPTLAGGVEEKPFLDRARARVVGPPGGFFEIDPTDASYAVAVPAGYWIEFSANGTTVDQGDPADANYTWRWGDGAEGYGPLAIHRFGSPGSYGVNLTVTAPVSGNLSYFLIRLTVDGEDPVAAITTNVTGPVHDSVPIAFSGATSLDDAGPGLLGRVVDWWWDFEHDAIIDAVGRDVSHAFDTPGVYLVTLWVEDWVHHNSPNATLAMEIIDATVPIVRPWTLHRVSTWEVVHEYDIREDSLYSFNASTTTDNTCEDSAMIFNWTFESPSGRYEIFTDQVNITYAWPESGTYAVNLTVTDCAGNVGYRLFRQAVQVDLAQHSNLQIQDIQVSPTSAQEDTAVTITVTVKHIAGNLADRGITITAARVENLRATAITVTGLRFLDSNNVPTDATLAVNETKKAQFTYNVGTGVGRFRVSVTARGSDEPDVWVTEANSRSVTITVTPAYWKPYVLPAFLTVLAVAGALVLVALYLATRKPKPRKKPGGTGPRPP